MPSPTPDLTKRPPRSPRVRLGGYVILPRMLDKGRATIAKKNGEFCYDCPLDGHFLKFVGIKGSNLKKQLAAGKGDGEILAWIRKNAKHKQDDVRVAAWSAYMENRAPADLESHQFFLDYMRKTAPKRDDAATWFDLLDIDDHVTFGGRA